MNVLAGLSVVSVVCTYYLIMSMGNPAPDLQTWSPV